MHVTPKLFALTLAAASTVALAETQPTAEPQPLPSAQSQPIVFDTVSVKPNKSNEAHPGESVIQPDGFYAQNMPPVWTMYWAFGHGGNHDEAFFSGLPGWVISERYDIIAKVAGADVPMWGQMSGPEQQKMIRDVFTDRFKLQTHFETHQQPIYALVVAKGGAKLKPAKAGGDTLLLGGEGGPTYHPSDGWFGTSNTGIVAGDMTLEAFAAHLTSLGRPVEDRTGVKGRYNFKLDFAPMTPAPRPVGEDPAPAPIAFPDIFTAIQEQLGLKLESAKGPVQTLVIDHIERPTEN